MNNFKLGGMGLGFIIVLGAILSVLCLEVVNPGYAGIVYNRRGGIEDRTLTQGWHFVSPMKKVTDYPISTETIYLSADSREGSKGDDSFLVPSKDGKQIRVGTEFNYHYDIEMLPKVFIKFRGQDPDAIAKSFITGKIKAWSAEATALYQVMDLYGEKRAEASRKAQELMTNRFAEWGIIVENFNFIEVLPDEKSLQAIQDRVDASQKLETSKIQQEQAKVEAETKIIKAKGESEAELIKAKNQSKANELLTKSMTNSVLMDKWIEKWDGKMPAVNSHGSDMLMQIPTLSN